jgi:hypothetical protein
MAYSDSTTQQFMGGLMAGLNGLGTSPLFNIGMGLMSAAKPYGNVGDSLMAANQATMQNRAAAQNLAINRVNMQRAQTLWPAQQSIMQSVAQRMLAAQQGAQGSQQPQGGTPQQPLAPNQYRPPPPLSSIAGDPAGDVQLGQAMSFMGIPGADAFTNAPKNLEAARDLIVKQRQQQVAPTMATLDSLSTAANAHDIVRSDPELNAYWQETAPRLGLNPVSGLTPENARAFGRFAYNGIAGSSQLPTKPMPDIYDQIPGANGQVIQRNRTTGQISEPIPQKLPTFALQKSWDPNTGRDVGIMVQTSPGGSAAPAAALGTTPPAVAPSVRAPQPPTRQPALRAPNLPQAPAAAAGGGAGAPGGGLGQQASGPIDLGYEKPTDTQLKVATLANYARSSIPVLQQLEASGYRMSPTTRTAVIKAATDDDPTFVSQWFSQEMLAHKLSPQDQQYMAALMPFLQAAGHDMSGARLTTPALRQAFESTIPVDSKDPQYMADIANNRKQLYSGLLAGSANAAQMPEFKNTLGADQAALAQSGRSPVKVSSPAQARALAPGTVFITPDGRLKVR